MGKLCEAVSIAHRYSQLIIPSLALAIYLLRKWASAEIAGPIYNRKKGEAYGPGTPSEGILTICRPRPTPAHHDWRARFIGSSHAHDQGGLYAK